MYASQTINIAEPLMDQIISADIANGIHNKLVLKGLEVFSDVTVERWEDDTFLFISVDVGHDADEGTIETARERIRETMRPYQNPHISPDAWVAELKSAGNIAGMVTAR
ncbi:MAG: hypothetical protein OER96_06540 [Gammaproteobacteria bacterium]|nr:hypothetical protein [Gammaproteobacteria bacterium]